MIITHKGNINLISIALDETLSNQKRADLWMNHCWTEISEMHPSPNHWDQLVRNTRRPPLPLNPKLLLQHAVFCVGSRK